MMNMDVPDGKKMEAAPAIKSGAVSH
jgi:hypothetical protein